jgi:hypothetical protein
MAALFKRMAQNISLAMAGRVAEAAVSGGDANETSARAPIGNTTGAPEKTPSNAAPASAKRPHHTPNHGASTHNGGGVSRLSIKSGRIDEKPERIQESFSEQHGPMARAAGALDQVHRSLEQDNRLLAYCGCKHGTFWRRPKVVMVVRVYSCFSMLRCLCSVLEHILCA